MIQRALKSSMLTATLLCFVGTVPAAGYLKIGDIKGESTAVGYEDWIDVLSMEWERPSPSHVITGGESELVLPDIIIRKRIDKSSPLLMRLHGMYLGAERGLNPDPPPQDVTYVQVLPFSTGEDQVVVMWELKNVIITSWSTSGDADDRPTEEVAFAFGAARQTYFQRAPDGDLIGVQTQGFVLREGSIIPPPPEGSTIDSFIIGDSTLPGEVETIEGVAMTEDEVEVAKDDL